MKVTGWTMVRNGNGEPVAVFGTETWANEWIKQCGWLKCTVTGPHDLDLPDAPRGLDVIAKDWAEAIWAHQVASSKAADPDMARAATAECMKRYGDEYAVAKARGAMG